MSVECKRSKDFADTLESFLCQSYIKQGAFVLGAPVQSGGHLSGKVRFYTENGRFAFLTPTLGVFRATYDDHLRLIGKRVVDFILVLIELFSLGVYG